VLALAAALVTAVGSAEGGDDAEDQVKSSKISERRTTSDSPLVAATATSAFAVRAQLVHSPRAPEKDRTPGTSNRGRGSSPSSDRGAHPGPLPRLLSAVCRAQLFGEVMRLEVRPSYTRETTQRLLRHRNASVAPDASGAAAPEQFEYGRHAPTLLVRAPFEDRWGLYLEVGIPYLQSLDIPREPSWRGTSPFPARQVFGPTGPHAVDLLPKTHSLSIRAMTRSPLVRGVYHKSSFARARRGRHFFYRYAQTDVILRFYFNPSRGASPSAARRRGRAIR